MKGGSLRRWYGNQQYVVNFWNAGLELKEEQIQKYPYIGGNTGWIVPAATQAGSYQMRSFTFAAA